MLNAEFSNRASKKRRSVNLDLIRSIAVLFVISVHFFLNSGFYTVNIAGKRFFLGVCMRTLFMTCVPLFMLLTGYLMNGKKLSAGYFRGITKTLAAYLLSAIFILLFTAFFLKEQVTLRGAISDILGFTHYSWYIEMYIGLFLLIPFLNLIYNNLDNKRQKLLLIAVLIILTVLPSALNIFDFASIDTLILHPERASGYTELIPQWWIGIYPITYYFIGAFIREYKDSINISAGKCFLLLLICLILFGLFNYRRSYGMIFVWGKWNDWGGFQNVIDSVLLFIFLLKLNTERFPRLIKKCLYIISELSLGAYLLSWISDKCVYGIINGNVSSVADRLYYFPIAVIAVFALSLLLSAVIKLIYIAASKLFALLHNRYSKAED